MKKSKRMLCTVLAALMIIGSLTACGGSGTTATTTAATTAAVTTAATAETTTAATAATTTAAETTKAASETTAIAAKEVQINWPAIWVAKDSKAPAISEIVTAFNSENAGKIKVVLEENSDYQAYRDKIRTSISSNNVPDFFTFDDSVDLYLTSGKLMDLTSHIDNTWKDTFLPGAIDLGTRDGITSALPFELGVTPVMYNKKLLEQVGYTEFPKDFDEFFKMCDALKAAGITPMSQMTGENSWTSMLWYSQIVSVIGGPDVYKNGLDDPAFEQAAEIIQKMFDYTTSDAVGAGAGVSAGHFLNERTAIFMNGPWFIGRLKNEGINDLYKNVGIAPTPMYNGGKGQYGSYIGYVNAFITAGKQTDKAKEDAIVSFMKYLTKSENVQNLSQTSGAMFYVKTEASADTDPIQAEMMKQANEAPYLIGHFNYMNKAAVANEFPQALSSLVLKEITPKEFVAELKAKNE